MLDAVRPAEALHQRIEAWLIEGLASAARNAGMYLLPQAGLYDPAVRDGSSLRVPDVMVAKPEHVSERGVEGRAELVAEVRELDDDTYDRLPFYERVGVFEVLVIELERRVRRWVRMPKGLIEIPDTPEGLVALDSVPIRVQGAKGTLRMTGPGVDLSF